MEERFDQLYRDFRTSLEAAGTAVDLAQVKADFVGKKGRVSAIMKGLRDADPKERKAIGMKSNDLKNRILQEIDQSLKDLKRRDIDEKLAKEWIDATMSDSRLDKGLDSAGYHPLSLVQREVEDIFFSMGFEILDGPHQ